MIKNKGCYLSHNNRQFFNFDALAHVISRAHHIPIDKLALHEGETLKSSNYYCIEVKINAGKWMIIPYSKRAIEFPWNYIPKMIDTPPLGHFKIPFVLCYKVMGLQVWKFAFALTFLPYSAFDSFQITEYCYSFKKKGI